MEHIPTPSEVKEIYKQTYILYEQYKDIQSMQEFEMLHNATHDLERKLPFELTRKMIVNVVEVIEAQLMERLTD